MLFTGLFTVAADWVPASRRTEGLALYSASSMLPISLGGLLGDAILARASYDALFVASACFAALSFADHDPARGVPARAPRRRSAAPASATRWCSATSSPLWFLGTVFGLVLTGVFVFVKRFVMETEVATVGTFFSAYTGAAIAVRLVGGRLPDRVGPKRVLLPALATLVAGFVLPRRRRRRRARCSPPACSADSATASSIRRSRRSSSSRASEVGRGAAISIHTSLPDVGGLLGAPLLGWMIEARGFSAMFASAGAMLALGSLVVRRMGSPGDARLQPIASASG